MQSEKYLSSPPKWSVCLKVSCLCLSPMIRGLNSNPCLYMNAGDTRMLPSVPATVYSSTALAKYDTVNCPKRLSGNLRVAETVSKKSSENPD